MPMADYRCESCGYRFENFFSDPPESQSCPALQDAGTCGGYAPRINSLPGEYRPVNALRFDPIVVFVSNDDPTKVSVPSHNWERPDNGYHAVEIKSIQEADHFIRNYSSVERAKMEETRELNKMYWDERTKERRYNIREKIGSNPRANALFREVCKYVDRKREGKYSKKLDPRAHFQIIENDRSNRQSYSSSETGWRERHG